jgi:C1A family cysteine protease
LPATAEAALYEASPLRPVAVASGRPGIPSASVVAALSAGVPVAFSVVTPAEIWGIDGDIQVRQSGVVTMPFPGTDAHSAHALCAVGYGQDADFAGGGYILFRNSWDVTWAPGNPFGPDYAGYGFLPLAYLDNWGLEAFTC